jgi:P4 family phage/plasmid primase-like protien
MEISLDYLTECLSIQQKTAQLFNAKHQNLYKYSKKYLFSYDEDDCLWKETFENDVIAHISSWITAQYDKIILTTPTVNEFDKKKINAFTKLYTSKTTISNISSVFKYYLVEIKDDKLLDNLNRAQPYLLPIKNNKIVDLKTGDVRRRQLEDYFTYYCDVEPTKKKSLLFNNFINDIMCRNQEAVKYLQTILGYSMSGDISAQSVFIMWGNGSNGKSVLLNLISSMMGDAYKPASKNIFLNMGKSSAGEELIDVKDRRIITYSETADGDNLNEELIKMISGGDVMTARGLYKSCISFKLICKLLLITNNKPKFNGNDFAMVRRIKFLPFQAKFVDIPIKKNEYKKNPNLEKELIENHLDEFFTFCLEGAINYFKTNKLIIPKNIGDLQQEYLESQGNIDKWFRENIVAKEGKLILRSATYANYKTYCEDNAVNNIGKSNFFDKIKEYIGEPVNKKYNGATQMCYEGFAIISEIEKEEIKKEEKKKELDNIPFIDNDENDKISLEATSEEEEEADPPEMKVINYKLNNKK